MQGGGNPAWLVPCKPDGTRDTDGLIEGDVIGTHTGNYAGLCVANPQPGRMYQWANRNPRSLLAARHRGWRPVSHDSGGARPAYELGQLQDPEYPTPLDTAEVFQDVVLVETSEENWARLQKEREDRAAGMLKGAGAASFLAGATDAERMTGQTASGNFETRFVCREHGILFQEGEDYVGGSD